MTTLLRLAQWAHDLAVDDVPPRIQQRVRLQHLNLAGAMRASGQWPLHRALASCASGRGAAALVGGRRASRRDALRVHAALGLLLRADDWMLGGHVGLGSVPAAWAQASGHSVSELIGATVAGNEVAARLGAAALLGSISPRRNAVLTAVAAATTTGILAGLSSRALASALSLACLDGAPLSWRAVLAGDGSAALAHGAAAVRGMDAVDQARAGVRGPIDLLDAPAGLLDALTPVPLRAAFTGLGRAWLCDSLAFAADPVDVHLQAPLQAVAEVLARHRKAADKRLRADQIQNIHLTLPWPALAVEAYAGAQLRPGAVGWTTRLAPALGRFVATQGCEGGLLVAKLSSAQQEVARDIAARVTVGRNPARSLDLLEHLVDTVGPLFAGLTLAELGELRRHWGQALDHSLLSQAAPRELIGLLRRRPDRLVERLRYQSGDLADARLDELQLRLSADLRLHTTRGGSWPEHRDRPVGSPGWPWQDTVELVKRKWVDAGADRGDSLDLSQADALLTQDGPGAEWAAAMLQPA